MWSIQYSGPRVVVEVPIDGRPSSFTLGSRATPPLLDAAGLKALLGQLGGDVVYLTAKQISPIDGPKLVTKPDPPETLAARLASLLEAGATRPEIRNAFADDALSEDEVETLVAIEEAGKNRVSVIKILRAAD